MSEAQRFSFYCDECDARFGGQLQANIDIFEWPELIDQDICIYCVDEVKSGILLEREGQVYEPSEYDEWMDFDPDC